MKNKKMLGLLLALLTLGLGATSVSATAILHPGYINGAVNVTGLVGTEVLRAGSIDAYSLTEDFDGHTAFDSSGVYHLTVEGDHEYKVFSRVGIKADYSTFYYQADVTFDTQETYVAIGETVDDVNFEWNPGRIAPIVTVIGGEIQKLRFYVRTDYEIPESEAYAGVLSVYSKPGYVLTGDESTFPMIPWVSNDANGDGDYIDPGDTYVSINGAVWIDNIEYNLPGQLIDVVASETTVVEWTVDNSCNIYGNIEVEGEDIWSYTLYGRTWINGIYTSFHLDCDPSVGHNLNLPPADWEFYSYINFRYEDTGRKTFSTPVQIETLETGDSAEVSWYIVPGYISGSIDFYGAHGNLVSNHFYAGGVGSSNALSPGNNYRLIVHDAGGQPWDVGWPYEYFNFEYDDPAFSSQLQLYNYGTPSISVEAGTEVTGVDFSYPAATITVQYRVDLDDGTQGYLRSPYLIATSSTGPYAERIVSIAKGWGSDALTTLGECTITVLAGTHYIEAYAYVDGSNTKFGDLIVTVETGDEVTLDIEAPEVDISQPGGSEHICGSTVNVVGTTTDISGVESITVNGVDVGFTPTGNQEDENEVSFSTTVGGLVVNEWNIITIIVTDTQGNSITVERQVFRDVCNLPPEIISIEGPMDPVSIESSADMFATFTDPDIDDYHTAVWDWGDGSTSAGTVDQTDRTVTGDHFYEIPGVYTVSLTVTDSYGESDTDTWSLYCVIYDPADGFVTGGGWIDSPLGAFPADPTLTGTANFGFVAKYKRGANVPMGTTEFQFHAGDINFHSDSYDWLVIAGEKAMFKGTGTINGSGSYKFLVTAVDGKLIGNDAPDMFRIKIWTEDEVTGEEFIIYDNGPDGTVLGGGSITIHKG